MGDEGESTNKYEIFFFEDNKYEFMKYGATLIASKEIL